MEFFRRLDRAWARGEGALTVLVLLSMVFVAAFSAGIRNLTRFDIPWASVLLTDMEWADSFLRKATMWLAFLGASQACFYRKHISIDVLVRIAPVKQRFIMLAASGIIAALITFAMSFSLWKAVELNLAERPIEYDMLTETGSQHVCDATPEQIKTLDGVEVPTMFCGVRRGLKLFGVTAETPGAAFQLVVPFMFIVMGLRFLGVGIGTAIGVAEGEESLKRMDDEEHARQAAVHAAVGGHAGLNESPLDSQIPIPPAEPEPEPEHARAEGEDADYDPEAANTRISEEFVEGAPIAEGPPPEVAEVEDEDDDHKNGPKGQS